MDHNTKVIKNCLTTAAQAAVPPAAQTRPSSAPVPQGIGRGQFLLTDHLGRLVTNESMKGKYQILYFGYTYCPDICPTSLQIMFQAPGSPGRKVAALSTLFHHHRSTSGQCGRDAELCRILR